MNTYLFYVQFIFGGDMLTLSRWSKSRFRRIKPSGAGAVLNMA